MEQRRKLKKCFVSYFKSNGIIVLKKHVDENHELIVKNFGEKMNRNLKSPLDKQHAMNKSEISNFLGP
jgi:hypothetical protein